MFNLSFLSKVLEKVVAKYFNLHINGSKTANPYQSAYKTYHSTETALLKIHSGILSSMDDGSGAALTLLDLSAALDITDHSMLLNTFWVTGSG